MNARITQAPLDASMRQLGALALFPLAGAALVILAAQFAPPPSLKLFFHLEAAVAEALAFIGSAIAARAFDRDDYLRSAWVYQATCFLFIFLSDLTRFPGFPQAMGIDIARGVLSLIGNGSAIVSAFRFGRAWTEADLPDAVRTRRRAYVATAIVAFALAGGPLVHDLRAFFAGYIEALTNVASELGDIGSLCMLAPVLPTAIALRGGTLAWPWSFLGASLFAWLAFDGAVNYAGGAHVDDVTKRMLVEVFRGLGCTLTLSAGLAQRHVLRLTQRTLTPPTY
ncbi:hypothetical protein LZC95_23835 [Pendulispora brunnea]|uniref:Uncharacterized protein n=1 Tax=Pendulispora brunnea TaxID=2905690 RepID=A0ABZ2KRA2_9BACT